MKKWSYSYTKFSREQKRERILSNILWGLHAFGLKNGNNFTKRQKKDNCRPIVFMCIDINKTKIHGCSKPNWVIHKKEHVVCIPQIKESKISNQKININEIIYLKNQNNNERAKFLSENLK